VPVLACLLFFKLHRMDQMDLTDGWLVNGEIPGAWFLFLETLSPPACTFWAIHRAHHQFSFCFCQMPRSTNFHTAFLRLLLLPGSSKAVVGAPLAQYCVPSFLLRTRTMLLLSRVINIPVPAPAPAMRIECER
jgi:hypothetical protein